MTSGTPRGRPRDTRHDHSIPEATRQLIAEEGIDALTLDKVARRANVGKPTIYRRWTSKAALVFDAVVMAAIPRGTTAEERLPVPDTGSLEGDVRQMVAAIESTFSTLAAAGVAPQTMAEIMTRPELAGRFARERINPSVSRMAHIFERSRQRGELAETIDGERLIHAATAVAFYRSFVLHQPCDADCGERLTGSLVAAAHAQAKRQAAHRC